MCSVAVTVTPGQVPQIILFSAIPSTINAGQSATLQWSVQNSTSISINNGVGTESSNTGSVSVSPATTTTYTLTAMNSGRPVYRLDDHHSQRGGAAGDYILHRQPKPPHRVPARG